MIFFFGRFLFLYFYNISAFLSTFSCERDGNEKKIVSVLKRRAVERQSGNLI